MIGKLLTCIVFYLSQSDDPLHLSNTLNSVCISIFNSFKTK